MIASGELPVNSTDYLDGIIDGDYDIDEINNEEEDFFEDNGKVDLYKLYIGKSYHPIPQICITAPSVEEVIEYGVTRFFSMMSIFTANTTSMRVFLWDNGIDWNKITDFELFCMMVPQFKQKSTKIIFGDLDFSTFRMGGRYLPTDSDSNEEPVIEQIFHNSQSDEYLTPDSIIITEDIYKKIAICCRSMINSFPEVQKVKRKIVKEAYVEDDRKRMITRKKEEEKDGRELIEYSSFFPLLSFLLNNPGFKYRKDELDKVNIFEFMDSANRILSNETSRAVMNGMYGGFVDSSKIKPETYDLTKDLYQFNNNKWIKMKAENGEDKKDDKEKKNHSGLSEKVQEKLKSLNRF